MKRLGIAAVVLMMLAPVSMIPAGASSITTFSGGAVSHELTFAAPGFNNTTYIDVPNPSIPLNGSMTVQNIAGGHVLSPQIAVGGAVDWRFAGAGYGELGMQDRFSDNTTSHTYTVSGGTNSSRSVRLPKAASISGASLTMSPGSLDPQSANISESMIDIGPGYTAPFNITGIAPEAAGINATVQVTSAKKIVKDQEQNIFSNSYDVGYSSFAGHSLAQTFKTSVDGDLVQLQLYFGMIDSNVNNLFLEIRSTDAQEIPTSTLISNTMIVPQNAINADSWNTFSFSNVHINSNKAYAIVVYAKLADTSGGNAAYSWNGSGNTNPYNSGKLWTYNTLDGSGAPQSVNNIDLSFRVFIQSNLTSPEMANLRMNTRPPTSGPDPSGAYYYIFPAQTYPNDAWPLNITNGNVGFNVTSLNFTATTYFVQYVRDVDIDIASLFQDALNNAPATADAYGNQMCTIPINFSAKGYGNLTFSALDIEYTCSFQVPDFTAALSDYLAGAPNGTVRVPVEVRASSAGALRLSGLEVLVDAPPVLSQNIPDLTIKQETSNLSLVDVASYFSDDRVDAVDQVPLEFDILSNSNSSNVLASLNGSVLGARALTVNWSGRTDVVVQASDGRGLKAQSNRFSIIVTRVNKPPVITSVPPERAESGKNFTYNVTADDDYSTALVYRLTERPQDMTVTSNGSISWKPKWDERGLSFNVTVNVSDGELSVSQRFNLSVFSNDVPPSISPLVISTAYAGKPYSCQIIASGTAGEPAPFSLDVKPSGMTINATTGLIGWAAPVEGNHTVIVNVTDGIGYSTYLYILKVVKNTLPKFTATWPAKATVGEELRFQVTASDTENQTLSFSLVKPPSGMSITARGLLTWTPGDSQKGTNHVVINVTDGLDNATGSFDIEVAGKPVISMPGGNDFFVWLLLILVLLIVCAAASVMYYRKWKKDRLLEQRWPEMPKKPAAITPLPPDSMGGKGPGQKGAAPGDKEAILIHEKPEAGAGSNARVQDIFVIYRDGRLIHHLTNRLTPLDHEIFASMFSSVQDFMKDSMGANRIDSIRYEEYNIILENGKNIGLAVVLSGDEVPDIRQVIKTSISDIELVCARLLEKWDGDAAPLRKDLELLLKPISEAVGTAKVDKKVKHKHPEEYVSILSGIEFFRGYVKVKMEVHNDLDNVITDAMIKIIVKQDALRIGWAEPPAYSLQGDSIIIGNVQPGETIALSLFLDPLVCTGSFVDATLTFKDAKGDLYSIVMTRRKAEVVCPNFHTDDEINVAVLRKMITEFQQHDTKIYTLPEGLWAEEAFKMGMSVIETHNVRLVREFTETTPAYWAEAWYYGRTQIKKEQVVMRISVSRESNTLEFFVGSSDLAAITGLLADFGFDLNRRLKNKGIIQHNIRHLDLTDKDRVNRKSQLLLHRYAEAEAGAAENEPKK